MYLINEPVTNGRYGLDVVRLLWSIAVRLAMSVITGDCILHVADLRCSSRYYRDPVAMS